MPDPVRRTLTEAEFTAVRDKVLKSLPDGLSEADFHRAVGPRLDAALAEAEYSPAPLEGSMLSRAARGLGSILNPVTLVDGVAQTVLHPIETAKGIVGQHAAQIDAAKEAWNSGDRTEAVGHGFAAAVPLMGPMAAQIGEQAAAGDVAGAMGATAGLLLPVAAKPGLRALARGAKAAVPVGAATRAADALEQSAAAKVVDVMAPKVGREKVRFGGMAQRVAPDLLQRGEAGAWTRQGLQQTVQQGLDAAEAALDTAADARLRGRAYPTQPIIDDLLATRAALLADPVEGSRRIPSLQGPGGSVPVGRPIGQVVEPLPHADRLAAIDQVIDEVKQLGPVARYDALKTIRQAWDGVARVKYAPSVTQDFLKKQGYASGAADAAGALRDHLARFDPETAAANADYSFYRTAHDVLKATEEIERSRPTVGRQIMTKMTGSVVGGAEAGPAGALVGLTLGPVLDSVLSSGVTVKLQAAQTMQKLASAIRSGNPQAVESLAQLLKRVSQGAIVAKAAAATKADESRSPSPELQTAP